MKNYNNIFNDNIEFDKNFVKLSDIIFDEKVKNLTVPLGIEKEKDKKRYVDFNDISCLLVGGETGSGKSVFLNSIIVTLLLNNKNIEFIMMDPKRIELSYYKYLKQTRIMISDNKECFKELNNIYNEYINRKKKFKNFKNLDDFNKNNDNKLNNLFIIIDESCLIMEINESENLLYNMINDCCNYGIHFIIASNSIWKKYFSQKFINNIKYIISFDLADEKDAKMLGNVKAKDLSTPGNALAMEDDTRYKEFNIQTPYISDEEIINAINFVKNNE